MKKSLMLNVYGRVQNVGFRFYTKKTAEMLKIKGFVKNKPDGSVYIEAVGDENNMNDFIKYCRKGPTWANVTKVDIQDCPVKDFNGFSIQ